MILDAGYKPWELDERLRFEQLGFTAYDLNPQHPSALSPKPTSNYR